MSPGAGAVAGGGGAGKQGEQSAFKSLGCLASPALTEACKQFGKETLLYLASLEEEGTRENDGTAVKSYLSKISAIAEVGAVLVPRTVTELLAGERW